MKASALRDMTDAELQQKEREFKKELFNFRFQVSTGQQLNTAGLTAAKRKIARVKTILRERQLKNQTGSAPNKTEATLTQAPSSQQEKQDGSKT
ncbi:50S ribosomal protein L29 [Candidatus Acetothermia bacterium]|nr:50S ribosomal protein L29 [Candidatus Acetothermia bacterium]MBI3460370.1 50S ribosomal protein L29 [Candidatus Acetothermia bacterium]MBI3659188.1 50S ribosomal protein L29 [Candidatus Acetothermia bacterium]